MGKRALIASSCILVCASFSASASAADSQGPGPVTPAQQATGRVESGSNTLPETSRWMRYPNAIEAHLSPGGPYGSLALAYDRSLADWFGIGIGAGIGASGPAGGLMARLRWPFRTVAPFIETGLSISPHESKGCLAADCERDSTWKWTAAMWGHAGAGLEVRGERLRFRFYLGAAKVLNESAGTCKNPYEPCGSTPPADVVEVPYAGVAFGYGF